VFRGRVLGGSALDSATAREPPSESVYASLSDPLKTGQQGNIYNNLFRIKHLACCPMGQQTGNHTGQQELRTEGPIRTKGTKEPKSLTRL
jgi:hypothetical protein